MDNKNLTAILTAISLAFFQTVPAGVAANTPADQIEGRSVPVPVKSATDTTVESTPAKAVIPPNPLMDTGGISISDKKALGSQSVDIGEPSKLTTPRRPQDGSRPLPNPDYASVPAKEDKLDSIVEAVQSDLAGRLEVPAESVTVVKVASVTWPNSCLGVDTGQRCKMVITPGYRITLEVNGVSYIYHTDTRGSFVFAGEPQGGTMTVIVPSYNILPFDVYVSAVQNISHEEILQLNAAMQDISPNTQYSIQTGDNGETSWVWTSGSDPAKTYRLERLTVQDVTRWAMVTQTVIVPPQPVKLTLLQKFLNAYGNRMPPAWRTYLTELSQKPEPEWFKNLKKFEDNFQQKQKPVTKKAPTQRR
ncbi:MAG: hypothetical protein BWY44_00689 [Candidatus Omnitrophica bacterium ADurb.Bin292]|nr:MAG: hypothetical protein BWY44_00689 [Candidatus Omnitrophica bacterium ADurb.Bin292]